MSCPLHTVVENPEFQRRLRGLLTADERDALIDYFAASAFAADVNIAGAHAECVSFGPISAEP